MATIVDPGYPTLANIAKRLRPDGSVETDLADLLTKKIPILDDIPWKESNKSTSHQVTAIYAATPPTWRRINQGIKPTKGETIQWEETVGLMEDYSDVDVKAAKINGNAAAYRASEDRIKKIAFGQECARAIFYENAVTSPERLHGFTPRFSGASGSQTENYVLKKGTRTGTNCESIWLINWDEDSCHGIFPKGSVAGLEQEDLGQRTQNNPDGTQLEVYSTHMSWQPGLCVRDYRRVVRMQWDPKDAAFAEDKKTLFLAIQEMIDTAFDIGPNARIYMSRKSKTRLNAQLLSNNLNVFESFEIGGRRLQGINGVPLRVEDSLVPESAI